MAKRSHQAPVEQQRRTILSVFGDKLRSEIDKHLPAVGLAVASLRHVDGSGETEGAQRRLGREQLDDVEQGRQFDLVPRQIEQHQRRQRSGGHVAQGGQLRLGEFVGTEVENVQIGAHSDGHGLDGVPLESELVGGQTQRAETVAVHRVGQLV